MPEPADATSEETAAAERIAAGAEIAFRRILSEIMVGMADGLVALGLAMEHAGVASREDLRKRFQEVVRQQEVRDGPGNPLPQAVTRAAAEFFARPVINTPMQ